MQKLPWSCYLPLNDYKDFKLPPTRSNSHQSKLYHEKLIREILLQEVNDLPIRREYAMQLKENNLNEKPMGFKKFKKQWLIKNNRESQENIISEAKTKVNQK